MSEPRIFQGIAWLSFHAAQQIMLSDVDPRTWPAAGMSNFCANIAGSLGNAASIGCGARAPIFTAPCSRST